MSCNLLIINKFVNCVKDEGYFIFKTLGKFWKILYLCTLVDKKTSKKI